MNAIDIDPNNPALYGCMVTHSGLIVNLFDIDPETILLEDIAHGLSYNCRWNGHTKSWYSIAEHCIRVHDRAPKDVKKLALFHDAEEAYWGDVIRPVKMVLRDKCPELLEKMKATRAAIFEKFGVVDGDGYKPFDNEELKWDFQNLILSLNHRPMFPHQAKAQWLLKARSFL